MGQSLVANRGWRIAWYVLFAVLAYFIVTQFRGRPVEFDNFIGVAAPPFTIRTLDGETINLKDFRGKRVVLDFWATWCGPCRKEIPHFIRLANEIPGDQLQIIGISDEDPETVRSFSSQIGVNYLMGSAVEMPAPFSEVRAIPTTFFIDAEGRFEDVAVGYRSFSRLRDMALGKD